MSDGIHTEVRIEDEADDVVTRLAAASGLSRNKVKQAMSRGAVWLKRKSATRRLRRTGAQVVPGDEVHLYYDESVLAQVPRTPTLIADERQYSVWFKHPGTMTHGSRWGDHASFMRGVALALNDSRPCLQLHRLDRAASGLIVVAHDRTAARSLTDAFRTRRIAKRYRALILGRLPQNSVATEQTQTVIIDEPIDGRDAQTRVRERAFDPVAKRSLVEVKIDTGRKHQIRIHLASLGCPIVGDRMHGGESLGEDLRLLAFELGFASPLGAGNKQYRVPRTLCPDWACLPDD